MRLCGFRNYSLFAAFPQVRKKFMRTSKLSINFRFTSNQAVYADFEIIHYLFPQMRRFCLLSNYLKVGSSEIHGTHTPTDIARSSIPD